MNVIELLQYAVVEKFSNGWPELEDLRRAITRQCDIKGECKISLLRNRHVLIRCERHEDFITIVKKCLLYSSKGWILISYENFNI